MVVVDNDVDGMFTMNQMKKQRCYIYIYIYHAQKRKKNEKEVKYFVVVTYVVGNDDCFSIAMSKARKRLQVCCARMKEKRGRKKECVTFVRVFLV